MKTVVGSVVAAIGASACCLGPVLFSMLGAGTLGAASTRLQPARPLFLGLTVILLGASFYFTYRRTKGDTCTVDGHCVPSTRRTAKITLWVVTVMVVLFATFPYYVNWLF